MIIRIQYNTMGNTIIVQLSPNFNNYSNFTPNTEKQEMYYLNYHNCFEFQIAQIGNMLPDWAVGPD